MKKRLLSLLLCLSFVLALVPTAAMAADAETDPLKPADLYYTLTGDESTAENPQVTLSKTAKDNGDGTYTITLSAEAVETVSTRPTEVVFLLDTSGSMRWCADGKANGCDHDRGGVWCDRVVSGETNSRLTEAKTAISTVVANLSKNDDTTIKYVQFGNRSAKVVTSYDTITEGNGNTPLSQGTKKALEQFTDGDHNKVLIIVADGDSNDGYPTKEVKEFKDNGGIVYTVGFTFSSSDFTALASTDCSYDAGDADELKVAMNEITTKVAGLISDTMGDGVELVKDSVQASGEGYDAAKLWTSEDGKTIYWTNKEGLSNKITLTYTVELTDAAKESAKENGADIPLNKDATLNYELGDKTLHLPFPVPVAHLDRELKEYTLTYESNGGTAYTDETYKEGTEVTIDKKPTREGYIFKGWYADEGLTEAVSKVTMDSNKTVYAKWAKEYTLTYVSNGGTEFPPETYEEGTYVGIKVPEREGYTFKGWYRNEDLSGDFNYTAVTMTENITLYAKWEKNLKDYTLTYVTNGGTEIPQETHKEGTKVDLSKIPTKKDYVFKGWYADEALTQLITEVTMDSDKTVYAGWKKDETPVLEKGDHSAYIVGYEDGTVRPQNNITRAEVAAIFYRLLTDDARAEGWATTNSFSDVQSGMWYNNGISTLANMKILNGYEDGTFRPNAYVTRAEFATIAAQFSGGPADEFADFTDVPKTHWASKYIAKAASLGWITGDGDGNFRPGAYITRAEAMSFVNRVLERGVDEKGLSEDAIQWPDNKPGDWYYYDVLEATNSHEYVRTDRPIKNRTFCAENWVKLKENRDWSAMEAEWEKLYGKK